MCEFLYFKLLHLNCHAGTLYQKIETFVMIGYCIVRYCANFVYEFK